MAKHAILGPVLEFWSILYENGSILYENDLENQGVNRILQN